MRSQQLRPTASIDLDAILVEIGERGRYQFAQYALLGLFVVLTCVPNLSYIFTTAQLDHRCRIPDLETGPNEATSFSPSWLPTAVPYDEHGKPELCSRYQSISVTNTSDIGDRCVPSSASSSSSSSSVCFNSSSVVSCDNDVVYDTDELLVVNAFNVTCPENAWKLTIVGTLGYVAQLIALPICAVLSDRYGRRPIIIGTVALCSVCGLIASWSSSYAMFVSMHFVTMLASGGTYMTLYVLAIEFAGPNTRVLAGSVISILYSVSQVLTGVLAMVLPDFRDYLRVLYAPMALVAVLAWLVPESVRWLLTRGSAADVRRVRAILLRAADVNGKQLSEESLASLQSSSDEVAESSDPSADDADDADCAQPNSFRLVIGSRSLLLRLANCMLCWFAVSFIYYGMNVHSTALPGNKHVNYILVNAVEVPAELVASLLMVRWGRARVLGVCLMLNAAACVAAEFIGAGEEERVAKLVVYVLGKSGVTISFTVLYVFTNELFPTAMRHSFMNACMAVGSVGSMIAPQTPLLARTWSALPLLLFGGSALLSGALVLLLPETIDTRLPDTVQQAEELGRDRRVKIKQAQQSGDA